MPDSIEPKPWWQSAPAIIAGIAAVLTATGAVLQGLSSSGISSLFGSGKPPEWEQVIDREYIVIGPARVWHSQDITAKPIAELRQAGSVIVRAKVKGAELYLIEYAQGELGYVVSRHLVESSDWRRQKDQEAQQLQREITPQQTNTVEPTLLEPSRSAADWIPYGTRLNPPWDAPVTVFQAPQNGAQQIATLPAGKLLPRAVFDGGSTELLQKIGGGAWYLVGSLNKPIGYVRGDEVTERWPRQQEPQQPVGKLMRTWETPDKIKLSLYDLDNHFDLYIKITCPEPSCTRITIYSGNPKNRTLDTRVFQSEAITGIWKKGQIANVYTKIPRQIVDNRDATLWICIGAEEACAPFEISPARSLS